MKYLTIILLLYTGILFSQKQVSGRVEYTIKLDETFDPSGIIEDNVTKGRRERLTSLLMDPANFILVFTQKESLYKKKDEEMKIDTKQNRFKFSFSGIMGGGGSIFYTNSGTKTTLVRRDDFGEDTFLVSNKMKEWILTQETKQIGKYTCYKALLKDQHYKAKSDPKSSEIIAWYTPQISVNFGPELYSGLPGLVLEVTFAKFIFTASKITLNPKEKVVIKKPKKGIKITKEEYDEKSFEFGKSIGF